MIIPTHLPSRFASATWPAVMGGEATSMRAQVKRYSEAGIGELIVCEYAVAPNHQAEALHWFAEYVAEYRADTSTDSAQ